MKPNTKVVLNHILFLLSLIAAIAAGLVVLMNSRQL